MEVGVAPPVGEGASRLDPYKAGPVRRRRALGRREVVQETHPHLRRPIHPPPRHAQPGVEARTAQPNAPLPSKLCHTSQLPGDDPPPPIPTLRAPCHEANAGIEHRVFGVGRVGGGGGEDLGGVGGKGAQAPHGGGLDPLHLDDVLQEVVGGGRRKAVGQAVRGGGVLNPRIKCKTDQAAEGEGGGGAGERQEKLARRVCARVRKAAAEAAVVRRRWLRGGADRPGEGAVELARRWRRRRRGGREHGGPRNLRAPLDRVSGGPAGRRGEGAGEGRRGG